jgi:hypothetical protein
MTIGSEAASIAKSLAAQEWKWDQESVESTLSSLGWRKSVSVLHRDGYTRADGRDASVYHDGDRPGLVEVEVDVFSEVGSLDDLAYEDKVDEFYESFSSATKQVSEYLGSPAFSDGAAANGFPDDQDAVWLSLWNLPSARLMLQQKHEDRDVPFRLCIVVAPVQRNGG